MDRETSSVHRYSFMAEYAAPSLMRTMELSELGQIQPLQLQKRSLYIESSGVPGEASF